MIRIEVEVIKRIGQAKVRRIVGSETKIFFCKCLSLNNSRAFTLNITVYTIISPISPKLLWESCFALAPRLSITPAHFLVETVQAQWLYTIRISSPGNERPCWAARALVRTAAGPRFFFFFWRRRSSQFKQRLHDGGRKKERHSTPPPAHSDPSFCCCSAAAEAGSGSVEPIHQNGQRPNRRLVWLPGFSSRSQQAGRPAASLVSPRHLSLPNSSRLVAAGLGLLTPFWVGQRGFAGMERLWGRNGRCRCSKFRLSRCFGGGGST
jgi:hypothetical protein